jgi:site-specific DNA recombinase
VAVTALMRALRPRPPFQVLVMSEESRLGREQIETAYLLKQLVTAGVRVFYYLEDRERTLDSPTEKLLLSVSAFADVMEREKARQRTTDAMRRKAEAGHVTGGVVYGYDNVEVLADMPGADGRPRRAHVIRRINPAEAAVVRDLYERYVAGQGLTRLAKGLNARGVPPPRGGGRDWAGTAVRAILQRELYRGVIVWNKSRKRDQWGATKRARRPAAEWLRIEAPDLQIVPSALWEAAQQRRARLAQTMLRLPAQAGTDAAGRARGGRLLGRPSAADYESPYLLTGLAHCAECGGPLAGFTRSHGRHRVAFYACTYHVKRGVTVCRNGTHIRQATIERAFLDALAAVLDQRMMEEAVREALVRLRRDGDQRLDRRGGLERERSLVEARTRHILEAVKAGYATTPVLQELEREEARKRVVGLELAALADLERVASLDAAQVSRSLVSLAADVRHVLAGRPGQARQMLRKLFAGHRIECRPVIEPDGTRGYHFRAEGSYAALLGTGVVTDGRVPDGIYPL